MTIRNLSDEVYQGLQEMAQANGRSMQEQVRLMLSEEVQLRRPSVCEQAAAYRRKLSGRKAEKNVLEDLSEDRAR